MHMINPTRLDLALHRSLSQVGSILEHKQEYLEKTALYEPINRLRFFAPNNRTPLQTQIAFHIDRVISILESRRLLLDTYGDPSANSVCKESLARGTSTIMLHFSINNNNNNNKYNQDWSQQFELDLNQFILEHVDPHTKVLSETRDSLQYTIQQSIEKREIDVLALYSATFPTSSSSSSANRRSRYSDATTGGDDRPTLASAIAHIQELRRTDHLSKEKEATQHLAIVHKFATLFELLHQTIVVLWQIVFDFIMRHTFEHKTVFLAYYTQLTKRIVLKMRFVTTPDISNLQ
ncbi:hypothetical protein BG004_006505 [Podila humilis]|nr:hypothetical protein BG004_006505 [Podila humilis]